jgi:type IV secretory pathway VirB3-like protein
MFGIPQAGLFIVFFLAVIFIYVLRLYAAAVPLLALCLVMRSLTAKDPFLIDIVLENIQQKDVYLP